MRAAVISEAEICSGVHREASSISNTLTEQNPMPTLRETILQALLAALQTVPDATILREDVLPERLWPRSAGPDQGCGDGGWRSGGAD